MFNFVDNKDNQDGLTVTLNSKSSSSLHLTKVKTIINTPGKCVS